MREKNKRVKQTGALSFAFLLMGGGAGGKWKKIPSKKEGHPRILGHCPGGRVPCKKIKRVGTNQKGESPRTGFSPKKFQKKNNGGRIRGRGKVTPDGGFIKVQKGGLEKGRDGDRLLKKKKKKKKKRRTNFHPHTE